MLSDVTGFTKRIDTNDIIGISLEANQVTFDCCGVTLGLANFYHSFNGLSCNRHDLANRIEGNALHRERCVLFLVIILLIGTVPAFRDFRFFLFLFHFHFSMSTMVSIRAPRVSIMLQRMLLSVMAVARFLLSVVAVARMCSPWVGYLLVVAGMSMAVVRSMTVVCLWWLMIVGTPWVRCLNSHGDESKSKALHFVTILI